MAVAKINVLGRPYVSALAVGLLSVLRANPKLVKELLC